MTKYVLLFTVNMVNRSNSSTTIKHNLNIKNSEIITGNPKQ